MLIVFFVVICILLYSTVSNYKKTEYYAQTKNAYLNVMCDKGRSGEYRIYKCLNSLEGNKKYLFNLYIPKDNGETTELDVVLFHDSGIYVFESKNYSGWIFGTETQKNWTQTLPMGRGKSQKNHFLNPIMQNKGHIKWLKSFLKNENLPVFSCIVFSERCTLKSINLTSGEHAVVKRNNILSIVRQNAQLRGVRLSVSQIEELYNKLYPLTQVNTEIKQAHVKIVQSRKNVVAMPMNHAIFKGLVNNSVCPQCGGSLKLKTASKGKYQGKQFWGCSNFPKCRYTKNI